MIKHVVMWRLADVAEGKSKTENALELKNKLEDLVSKIKEIENLEVGIDFSGSAAAYDIILYSEFRNKEHLKTYQDHPDHVLVKEFVGKISKERAVVDYELG